MKEHYKFTLKPLPYRYYDLEPYISEQTMKQHHIRHLGAYITNLNRLIEKNPAYKNMTLTELYAASSKMPSSISDDMRFFSGAVYNHNLFFSLLSPTYNDAIRHPIGTLSGILEKEFGSFENFLVAFRDAAYNLRGSGWVFLCRDNSDRPRIVVTSNHDRPPINTCTPVLLLDMWEHAYYLDYLDRKKEYIENFFRIINWQLVQMLWDSRIIYR